MQSKATTVDEYLQEVPDDRKAALGKIRQIYLEELPGYREQMLYGGPCYLKDDVIEIGFASQKHFIGIYIMKLDVMKKHAEDLKNYSTGKGCIRLTKLKEIDFDLIRRLVRTNYGSEDKPC